MSRDPCVGLDDLLVAWRRRAHVSAAPGFLGRPQWAHARQAHQIAGARPEFRADIEISPSPFPSLRNGEAPKAGSPHLDITDASGARVEKAVTQSRLRAHQTIPDALRHGDCLVLTSSLDAKSRCLIHQMMAAFAEEHHSKSRHFRRCFVDYSQKRGS